MGYNIGLRIIEEFLAKSGQGRCKDLKKTAEVIAQVGFKMFLGVTARVDNWSEKEFSLFLDENPLTDFVELPEKYHGLFYSNIIAGVIRGALEMVQMKVECKFKKCTLRGDDTTEIQVIFREYLADEVPPGDD
eukprot:CAMPEP_0177686786 /NCGR_PEP_ID=MMETSP0447-20121125/33765_1 /TAXON_ID=0 /ORGANISM="Stygamoeba regulata, Strain BSH-02190019" /LENGTH=132 /DNA_ID=CAMNT_0019196953 /DNA_START=178 /DNA_END=576 /DNA_ORIENTATION=-